AGHRRVEGGLRPVETCQPFERGLGQAHQAEGRELLPAGVIAGACGGGVVPLPEQSSGGELRRRRRQGRASLVSPTPEPRALASGQRPPLANARGSDLVSQPTSRIFGRGSSTGGTSDWPVSRSRSSVWAVIWRMSATVSAPKRRCTMPR